MTERLSLVPISLAEANAFVAAHHRHHRPVIGHKFSIGAALALAYLAAVALAIASRMW